MIKIVSKFVDESGEQDKQVEIFTEKDKIMINHKMCEIGKKTN